MKISFVINSLGTGGAERVLTLIARELSARHEVGILTFTGRTTKPFFDPGPEVRHTALGISTRDLPFFRKLLALPTATQTLRRSLQLQCPDVVISFMDQANLLTLAAIGRSKIPVIVSDRVVPTAMPLLQSNQPVPVRLLTPLVQGKLYSRAAAIVVQTEQSRKLYARALQPRLHVIPNPVSATVGPSAPADRRSEVLGVGRLVPQKRFDLLIEAFAAIAQQHPSWRLLIYGEGELRSNLDRQISALGLHQRVCLPGITEQPLQVFRQAAVFVLCSDYEGFPSVLVEAMSQGCAVVATDCPAGPGEIVTDGADGLLVPPGDAAALAQALDRLLGNPALRESLGEEAKRVNERFSLPAVVRQWEELVVEVVGRARR